MRRRRLETVLSIDLRSLACFRIGLAALLLADLAVRLGDFTAHYTELGILPRATLLASPEGAGLRYVSLHLWSAAPAWTALLFALAFAAGAMLLVGWRTRLATVASWLLLVSLQNRNPLVVYGGDNALVLLLFWSMLLPLGARLSLDARAGRAPGGSSVFTVAGAGLLLQIACIHGVSALHKRGAEWLVDGTAIFYALHQDQFARPLGVLIRDWDAVTRLLTHGTMVLEVLGPILLFVPFAFPTLRLVAVAGFVGLHLGIGLSLDLIHFSWISILTMVPFLPAEVFDRAPGPLRRGAASANPPFAPTRAATALAAAALAFVLAWNVISLRDEWIDGVAARPFLALSLAPAHLLRLGQRWSMFSPHPPRQTRWNVVRGIRADGSQVDLLREIDAPPSFDKPVAPADYYPSRRWERVFANGPDDPHVDAHRALAAYYCRRFAGRHPEGPPLERVVIFSRDERNTAGAPPELRPPRRLAQYRCHPAQSGRDRDRRGRFPDRPGSGDPRPAGAAACPPGHELLTRRFFRENPVRADVAQLVERRIRNA